MFLFLYIAIMFILAGTFLALNYHFKWIDQNWIQYNDIEFALGSLLFILWPIGLICLFVMSIFVLIRRYLIPD